jgi:peptidyl-prolyl cis-trans isomerase B (cyclophilin B)
MARTSDPHSATAQFFINVADNDFLDFKAPSRRAGAMPCSARWWRAPTWSTPSRPCAPARKGFHDDVPLEDVVIEKAVAL